MATRAASEPQPLVLPNPSSKSSARRPPAQRPPRFKSSACSRPDDAEQLPPRLSRPDLKVPPCAILKMAPSQPRPRLKNRSRSSPPWVRFLLCPQDPQMWKFCQEKSPKPKVITQHCRRLIHRLTRTKLAVFSAITGILKIEGNSQKKARWRGFPSRPMLA